MGEPRKLRGDEDKRMLIMDTMVSLVREFGLHGTAMSRLAREAGIAAGTIYYYFPSKEELIDKLYLDAKARFGEVVKLVNWASDDMRGIFGDMGHRFFNFYRENPEIFFFIEQCNSTPYLKKETLEKGKYYYRSVMEYISRGIDMGIFRKGDLNILTSLAYGSLVTAANLHLMEEIKDEGSAIDEAIEYAWRGLQA